MNIYFLGTCAGTEPMPNRKHTSFVIESAGHLYWFDAGEGCSYTAHNMGLDLLLVDKIIISHTHTDHVGGLGNLLFNIRKLRYLYNKKPVHGDVELYMPNMDAWDGFWKFLQHTDVGQKTDYQIHAHRVQDGVLFDDGTMKVTAYANGHIGPSDPTAYSFTYKMECEGKRVVYSGDIASYSELDEAIGDGCHALITETGHFGIDTAHEYISGKQIGKTFFIHSGREILNYPEQSIKKVQEKFSGHAMICEDGMTATL
ncbi:MAG: MBL fold metallo-hydrolase [Ruminococcaceae bacterium]|nr:MBL fold metallo-hydrolase [Oscillospiraceae bacterium]